MQRKHDGTLVIGSRSATMYIQGHCYHLMSDHLLHTRMSPGDVRNLPWDALERTTTSGAVITLHFSRYFGFSDDLLEDTLYITRSTRNDTVRRVLMKRRRAAAAFAMGSHARIGQHSVVQCLHADVLKAVVAFL